MSDQFDLRVSLAGIPQTIDSHMTGVGLDRVVRAETAISDGLKTLNDIAVAALVEGRPVVEAPADAKRGDVKGSFVVKKDGKPFFDVLAVWHDVTEAHAAQIGDAFAGLDDAVAKG